jgi:hypothetical protein
MNKKIRVRDKECAFCNHKVTGKTFNLVVYPMLMVKLGIEPASKIACDNCFKSEQNKADTPY